MKCEPLIWKKEGPDAKDAWNGEDVNAFAQQPNIPLDVGCWRVRWNYTADRWVVRHHGAPIDIYTAYAETAEEGMEIADAAHEEAWNAWALSKGYATESIAQSIVDKLLE